MDTTSGTLLAAAVSALVITVPHVARRLRQVLRRRGTARLATGDRTTPATITVTIRANTAELDRAIASARLRLAGMHAEAARANQAFGPVLDDWRVRSRAIADNLRTALDLQTELYAHSTARRRQEGPVVPGTPPPAPPTPTAVSSRLP